MGLKNPELEATVESHSWQRAHSRQPKKAPPKNEVERGKTLLMDLSELRTCLAHRKLSKVTGSDGDPKMCSQ